MHVKIVHTLGHRFVQLAAEGRPELAPGAAFRELIERCEHELGAALGLSLDDTVRTRLWGRSAGDREAASNERRRLLVGRRRAASSSYIAPGRFCTPANVAVELIAMEPHRRKGAKEIVEYEPPIAPPLFVEVDEIVFLSGLCLVEPTLAAVVPKTIAQLGDFMSRAGVGWTDAVLISNYVQREHKLADMERLIAPAVHGQVRVEYVLVDGHAVAGAHVEIEVTATRRRVGS